MPLELLNALRLVLLILIGIVVGIELGVGVARQLEETPIATSFLIRLVVLM